MSGGFLARGVFVQGVYVRGVFVRGFFVLIPHLILGKVAKFLVGKLSTSDVISQKPHGGMENTPPPVLLGLN